MRPPGRRLGVLLVSASAVAWSTGGLLTRLISVDSWTMLAWRGFFGAVGLALVLMWLPRFGTWRALRDLGWLGWCYVIQSAAGMIFFLTSLRQTTVAHVAVIYATVPFLAAGLSWLVMREKPTPSAVATSLIALAGVAYMVGFGRDGGALGDLLALGMTVTMAVAMVVARHYTELPFLPAACLSSLLSALIVLPFSAPLSASGHDLSLLAIFGITNFAIGLPLFTLGARLLPAIETGLIGSLEAPLAPLWVWWLLSERPSRGTLIGGTIVFAAVIIHLAFGSAGANRPAYEPRAKVSAHRRSLP